MPSDDIDPISAWFAGPKAENAAWFSERLRQIVDDYYAWRRNYYPEDGVVVGSALRRHNEEFHDAFEDRLLELLARLKGDVPFQSPRYAGHMLAEQTLPGIAGYFAAMLYNPNNVTADVAPVTVRLEIEAGQMLCRMIGYGTNAWAHLCSGGTAANLESLWIARSVRYLPLLVREVRLAVGLPGPGWGESNEAMFALSPGEALEAFAAMWRDARSLLGEKSAAMITSAVAESKFNVAQRGIANVCLSAGSTPVLLAPETHHYCFEKALDTLGLGRDSLIPVGVDSDFRMKIEDLGSKLDEIESSGKHVLAVVAVVGSTEEGSIDPVDQIVALRENRCRRGRSSFWLHADGAYGAYLRTVTIPNRCGLGERFTEVRLGDDVTRNLTLQLPEHGECAALEALAFCDSVVIDPHKLGYIPYPAGAVCFRNNLVKAVARHEAAYIDDATAGPEQDQANEAIGLYVLEGSKPGAAAAAVWLSHSLIPLDSSGHGRLMRETIRNACELHALLHSFPDLTERRGARAVCLCPPGSNIVCYAFRPEGSCVLEEINELNRAIFDRFNLKQGKRMYDQEFFVSRTALARSQYSVRTVGSFLERLGVSGHEYEASGVFLLRSVLMNPWYAHSKRRGRFFLCELVEELFDVAKEIIALKTGAAE